MNETTKKLAEALLAQTDAALAEYDALSSASAPEPVALTNDQIKRAWFMGHQSAIGHADGENNEDALRNWEFDCEEVITQVSALAASQPAPVQAQAVAVPEGWQINVSGPNCSARLEGPDGAAHYDAEGFHFRDRLVFTFLKTLAAAPTPSKGEV